MGRYRSFLNLDGVIPGQQLVQAQNVIKFENIIIIIIIIIIVYYATKDSMNTYK